MPQPVVRAWSTHSSRRLRGARRKFSLMRRHPPPTNGLALIGVPVGESANEELTEVDVMIDSSQGKEVPQDVRGVLVAEQAVVKSVSDSDLEAVARQGQPFFVHSESASQLPDRIGSSHFVLGGKSSHRQSPQWGPTVPHSHYGEEHRQ
eukprot:gene7819-5454_t